MECKFAFLCDYAQQDRKLHAIGIGWEALYIPQLPYKHPMMSFVAGLHGTIAEAGTKTVTIRLIDADGADVIPALQQQVAFTIKPPGLYGNINLVVHLNGVELAKYGPYAIHLVVQEYAMASVAFHVLEPPITA